MLLLWCCSTNACSWCQTDRVYGENTFVSKYSLVSLYHQVVAVFIIQRESVQCQRAKCLSLQFVCSPSNNLPFLIATTVFFPEKRPYEPDAVWIKNLSSNLDQRSVSHCILVRTLDKNAKHAFVVCVLMPMTLSHDRYDWRTIESYASKQDHRYFLPLPILFNIKR